MRVFGKRAVLISILTVGLALAGFSHPFPGHEQDPAGQLITGLAAAPVALELNNTTDRIVECVIQSLDIKGRPIDNGVTFRFEPGESRDLHVGDWNPAAESLRLIGDGITGRAVYGRAQEVVHALPIDATAAFIAPVLHESEATDITIINVVQTQAIPELTFRDRTGSQLLQTQLPAMEPAESQTLDLAELVPDFILTSAATVEIGPAGVIAGIDLPRCEGRLLVRSGSLSQSNTDFSVRLERGQVILHAFAYNPSGSVLTIRYQLEGNNETTTEGQIDLPGYATVDLLEGIGTEALGITISSAIPFSAMILAQTNDEEAVHSANMLKDQSRFDRRTTLAAASGTVCGGISATSGNPYTCSSPCLGANCVFYAWEAAYQAWGVKLPSWGSARYWGDQARNAGYPVDSSCSAGSIAVSTTLSAYGHVAWVTSCDYANKKVYVNQQDCYDKTGQTTIGKVWNMSSYQYYIHRPALPRASITATGSFGTARNGHTVVARVSNGSTAQVTFSSSGSTDGTGHQPSFRWLLNGTQYSTQSSFSSSLPTGTHKITLEVKSAYTGLLSTAWVTISVQQAPVADLLLTSGSQRIGKGGILRIRASILGTQVSFSPGATRAGSSPIAAYRWMYNGRVVSSKSSFTDRFFLRGTYQVLLRVTDTNGLFSDATATIIVI